MRVLKPRRQFQLKNALPLPPLQCSSNDGWIHGFGSKSNNAAYYYCSTLLLYWSARRTKGGGALGVSHALPFCSRCWVEALNLLWSQENSLPSASGGRAENERAFPSSHSVLASDLGEERKEKIKAFSFFAFSLSTPSP